MKPVFQTTFGEGNGNCHQAALASVLEMDLDEVPHFMVMENCWEEMGAWLSKLGFGYFYMDYPDEDIFIYTSGMHTFNNAFIIASVKTETGSMHSIVMRNGEVVHDPLNYKKSFGEPERCMVLFPLDPSKFIKVEPCVEA